MSHIFCPESILIILRSGHSHTANQFQTEHIAYLHMTNILVIMIIRKSRLCSIRNMKQNYQITSNSCILSQSKVVLFLGSRHQFPEMVAITHNSCEINHHIHCLHFAPISKYSLDNHLIYGQYLHVQANGLNSVHS